MQNRADSKNNIFLPPSPPLAAAQQPCNSISTLMHLNSRRKRTIAVWRPVSGGLHSQGNALLTPRHQGRLLFGYWGWFHPEWFFPSAKWLQQWSIDEPCHEEINMSRVKVAPTSKVSCCITRIPSISNDAMAGDMQHLKGIILEWKSSLALEWITGWVICSFDFILQMYNLFSSCALILQL